MDHVKSTVCGLLSAWSLCVYPSLLVDLTPWRSLTLFAVSNLVIAWVGAACCLAGGLISITMGQTGLLKIIGVFLVAEAISCLVYSVSRDAPAIRTIVMFASLLPFMSLATIAMVSAVRVLSCHCVKQAVAVVAAGAAVGILTIGLGVVLLRVEGQRAFSPFLISSMSALPLGIALWFSVAWSGRVKEGGAEASSSV